MTLIYPWPSRGGTTRRRLKLRSPCSSRLWRAEAVLRVPCAALRLNIRDGGPKVKNGLIHKGLVVVLKVFFEVRRPMRQISPILPIKVTFQLKFDLDRLRFVVQSWSRLASSAPSINARFAARIQPMVEAIRMSFVL